MRLVPVEIVVQGVDKGRYKKTDVVESKTCLSNQCPAKVLGVGTCPLQVFESRSNEGCD
jgi:hypothetical protein